MNSTQSFPKKLFRSLFDIGYYKEVLKQKTSKAVKFGIVAALFFGSLSMIQPLVEWNRTIDQIVQDMQVHLSPFTVDKGELVSASGTPYALNMAGLAIVVDPRSVDTPLQSDAAFGFYLTKDRVTIKNVLNVGESQSYKELVEDSFGKDDLIAAISTMRYVGWSLIPLGALYGVVLLFFSAVLTMFFGRVVFAISGKTITHRESFVVGIYTQVVAGTLFLLAGILQLEITYLYPLCLMVMGLYYFKLSRWDDQEHER